MSQQTALDRRLQSLIGAYADRAPVDVDPLAMTDVARLASGTGTMERLGPFPLTRSIALGLGAAALVLGLIGGLLLGSGGPTSRSSAVSTASIPPTARPTPRATPWPERTKAIGLVDLPPVGAPASEPASGELVLSYTARAKPLLGTRDGACCPKETVRLYADGRWIWESETDQPYGATPATTGLLEQRLTPEAVRRVLDQVRALGWFDHERQFELGGSFFWGYLSVWNGERMVSVSYTMGPRDDPIGPVQTSSGQLDETARQLHVWLVDPVAWLPSDAWAAPSLSAYIPTRYSICLLEHVDSDHWVGLPLGALPQVAKTFLDERGASLEPQFDAQQECRSLATEDARALIDILDAAGYRRAWNDEWALTYDSPIGDVMQFEVQIDPILPDGEVRCRCG